MDANAQLASPLLRSVARAICPAKAQRIVCALAFVTACAPNETQPRAAHPRTVRVSVFDSRGYLIPDSAEWLERNSGAIPWRAWTDEAGECELRLPALPPLDSTIRVRARDGRSASWAYDGRSATVQIALDSARARWKRSAQTPGALTGIVMRGSEATAGARVLARRVHSDDEPTLAEVRHVLAGNSVPGYLLAHTDDEGRFRVDIGASGNTPSFYCVWAFEPGWASARACRIAGPSNDPELDARKLPMLRVHGAILEFRDRGVPVAMHEGAGGELPYLAEAPLAQRSSCPLGELELLVAGAKEDDLELPPTSLRVLWHTTHSPPTASRLVQPIDSFDYRGMEVAFDALPLEDGLPRIRVDLERDASTTGGFGGLLLSLSEETIEQVSGALRGELVLHDARGHEYRYEASFERVGVVPAPFVPTGEFQAAFHTDDGRRVPLSSRLVVEPGWADLELAFAR